MQKSVPSAAESTKGGIQDGKEMTSSGHMRDMFTHLHTFMNDEMLCDYEVVAGDERIKVHKVIMAACSDYFRAMVTVDMKGKHDDVITLDTIDGVGLKCVVDYAYTGKVNLHMDTVSSVVKAASYLQAMSLLDLCETFLISSMDQENCVDILNLAEMYNLTETCKQCRDFIVLGWSHTMTKWQYKELSMKQLLLIVGDDRLEIGDEFEVVDIVKVWMANNNGVNWYDPLDGINADDDTWKTFTKFMSEIRWPLIRVSRLDKIDYAVKTVMQQIPECRKLLAEAKDYHSNIYTQPLKQTKRTRVRCNGPSLVIGNATENFCTILNLASNEYKDLKCQVNYPLRNKYLHEPKDPYVICMGNFLYASVHRDRRDPVDARHFFRYDPRFNEWLEMAQLQTSHGDTGAFLIHGQKIYLIGGHQVSFDFDSGVVPIQTCERYDIATNKWSVFTVVPQGGLMNHGACVVGNQIYISGGLSLRCYPDEVYKYDIHAIDTDDRSAWKKCSNMAYPRHCHIMENIDDIIFVIGGTLFDFREQQTSIIERYNTKVDQWTVCKQTATSQFDASYVVDDKIHIVGCSQRRDNSPEGAYIRTRSNYIKVFKDKKKKKRSKEGCGVETVREIPFDIDSRAKCSPVSFPHQFWKDGWNGIINVAKNVAETTNQAVRAFRDTDDYKNYN